MASAWAGGFIISSENTLPACTSNGMDDLVKTNSVVKGVLLLSIKIITLHLRFIKHRLLLGKRIVTLCLKLVKYRLPLGKSCHITSVAHNTQIAASYYCN